MRKLPAAHYADLRTGRILRVSVRNAAMYCPACGAECWPASEATKRHNIKCAAYGERVYPVRRAA